MEEITRKVVSYCEIPEELTNGSWISDYQPDCYVDYTLEVEDDEISQRILKQYPEFKEGDKIFIEIDY